MEKEERKRESTSSQISLNDIKLRVREINDNQQMEVLGGNTTFIGFKNPSTYLILTFAKGMKVIKDNKQVFSAKCSARKLFNHEIIYVDFLDCFLLLANNDLYRKDIDGEVPYFFMSLSSQACLLRYSKHNNPLILVQGKWGDLAVYDLKQKKKVLHLKNPAKEMIKDVKLFGEKEEKFISVARSGSVWMRIFNFSMKKLISSFHLKIDPLEGREEEGNSIAICDKNQHVLVEMSEQAGFCSRMLVFQIKGNLLVLKANVDLIMSLRGYKSALACAGYFDKYILWVGLTSYKSNIAQLYCYELESNELKELEKKRVYHLENWPYRLEKLGGDFYYCGGNGKVLQLSLNF